MPVLTPDAGNTDEGKAARAPQQSGTPYPLFLRVRESGFFVFYGVTHMEKITCTVNGQETAFAEGSTMEDVVRSLGADPAKVVVERNAVIVPREKFAAVEAGEGDVIEVVQFVGGG